MNLGPCFHQAALPLGKIAADELDCIDSEDTDVILVVRMEVRSMVGRRTGQSLAWQLALIGGGGAGPRDDQCPLCRPLGPAPVRFAWCDSTLVAFIRSTCGSGYTRSLAGFAEPVVRPSWRVGAPGLCAQRRRGVPRPRPPRCPKGYSRSACAAEEGVALGQEVAVGLEVVGARHVDASVSMLPSKCCIIQSPDPPCSAATAESSGRAPSRS
jgi:hypothetical protein